MAARLLEAERTEDGLLAAAVTRVCARLRRHFTRLVGANGCDLLTTRAVRLAQSTHPQLAGLRWAGGKNPDLVGLTERLESCTPEEAQQAASALTSALLTLLCKFLGPDLVLQQVRRAWAELPCLAADDEADGGGRPGNVG